ncbi:MAG: sulfatase-like hydrolase/transferase [Clostridia bacterium]|nr:sulfatase-like hydrolase/transferase [Clostridia bacterium]
MNSFDSKKQTRQYGSLPSDAYRGTENRKTVRRRPKDKDPEEKQLSNWLQLIFFPIVFVYLELVVHLAIYKMLHGSFFAYIVLFGFSAGLFVAVVGSLFNSPKVNYILSLVILGAVTVYFGLQLVYCKFSHDFFRWSLLEVGGQIALFWRETLALIFANTLNILLIILPFVLYAVFGRKIFRIMPMSWVLRIGGAALSALLFLFGVLFVNAHNGLFEDVYYYKEGFGMTDAVGRFGIITAARLDTKYYLFGNSLNTGEITTGVETTYNYAELFGTTEPGRTSSAPVVTNTPETGGTGTSESGTLPPEVTTEPPKPLDTSPNIIDIDFDSLIAKAGSNTSLKNAHVWFSSRTPTNKNEYTGMFEGKNLIFITVESWAPAAISKELTPTLWKMQHEGFFFENYFCSNWGGSTNIGEYANLTGNFYNELALWRSSNTYQPFTAANMLKAKGYRCCAFHNGEYTYYGREDSHKNYGYEWYAIKSLTTKPLVGSAGWNVTFDTGWPCSDRQLAENSLSFIPSDGSPFHIYYMTISGHPHQTVSGNIQSKKHYAEAVASGLPYTDENALSFIASQIEVELMVNVLIEDLEKKGILEDTVFVMAPDHYPYDITGDDAKNVLALAQLYNIPSEGAFINYNLYRAPLIIWSASMKESVRVTKVCSAIDVLPTVLNLFGLKYDSRLIMGHDILSTAEGFVILNMSNGTGAIGTNYNWISDYGFYNNSTKQFIPFDGVTVNTEALAASGYISNHSALVNQMYTYSKYILYSSDKNNPAKYIDYYRKVFPNGIPS